MFILHVLIILNNDSTNVYLTFIAH